MIAKPAEWSEDGEPPRILIARPRGKNERGPAPGVGARVLMRVAFLPDAGPREPSYSGRVVKILDKAKARVLGVYRPFESGGRASPVDKRAREEFFIPPGMSEGAENGDLVALEPVRSGGFGLPTARVAERLGRVVRETDALGRLGGDEFALLVEELPLAAGVEAIADRLHAALRAPFTVATSGWSCGFWLGAYDCANCVTTLAGAFARSHCTRASSNATSAPVRSPRIGW